MAVKVITRNYKERFTDGETDWLLGNVGDWQKLKLRVEVAVEFLASQQSPIEIDRINNAFILSTGNWGHHGFDNGMEVVLKYTTKEDTDNDGTFELETTSIEVFTINNVAGNVMEVEETIDLGDFDSIPLNYGTRKIEDVLFYVENDPEGVHLTYGHLTNANYQSTNLNSFIDGTETKVSLEGINLLEFGQWMAMEPIGLQSGMSIRNPRIKKVINNDGEISTSFSIPESPERTLVKYDSSGDNFTARPFLVNLDSSFAEFQTVTSESYFPQDILGNILGGNQNQMFLFNASESGVYQCWLNETFRITSKNWSGYGSVIQNFQICLLRFTGGGSLNFAEKTVLANYSDQNEILNRNESINTIFELNVTAGESFALAIILQDNDADVHDDVLKYKIINGDMLVSEPGGQFTESYKKRYDIELDFMVSSFFQEFADFENIQIPSYLLGEESLTDNFDIKFFPEWNNPNISISNVMSRTVRLGNTGWFNENFNELENEFEVTSLIYTDEDDNVVDSLNYASETHVKIVVNGVSNINANSEFGFGFAWVPQDEEDYKEKETPFYQNTFVSSGDYNEGFPIDVVHGSIYPGAGINGGSMNVKNVHFYEEDGNLVFEADFVPNATFFSIFDAKSEEDRNYVLWISVADGELVRNFSDRVSLLVDTNQLKKHIPVVGEYDQIENAFIEHPYLEDFEGVQIYNGIIQDDILCRMPLRIPTDGSKVFQSITFGVCVFNESTGQNLDLERYSIDLTQFPITNDGVHQIDVDTIRGFKLNSGNNKNWVKINRDENLDTVDFAGFLCYFGTKLRWEDWILNQNTLLEFFDTNELNNGLNHDWFHYFDTIGWKLNFFVEIASEENEELLVYKNRYEIRLADYDQNQNVAVEHNYFRDSDNTNINIGIDSETGRPLGVILSNEPTRVEMTFEILDSGTWDLLETYGVMTLELDFGAGRFEQRQLSSIWESESDNPLIPVEGETKLKLEVDGTNKFLTISALIDPELLEDGQRFRLTGRVGCNGLEGVFDSGLYEFVYEEVYE